MNQDVEHLRLLSIFHYVVAGLTALFGCSTIFHLGFGIAIVAGVFPDHGDPPPPLLGWMFIGIAGTMMAIGWGMAFAVLLAGRRLARHTHHTYCLVIAAIECVFVPFGTVLGVFTIVVLNRESVKQLFAAAEMGDQDATFSGE